MPADAAARGGRRDTLNALHQSLERFREDARARADPFHIAGDCTPLETLGVARVMVSGCCVSSSRAIKARVAFIYLNYNYIWE